MPWFLLNFIPSSTNRHARSAENCILSFNSAFNTSLELFAPTVISLSSHKGKTIRREAPLIYHYTFAFGELEDIKKLCRMQNGFSFVLNRGDSQRYATISDEEMNNFKRIARFYANRLPLFSLEQVDLLEGDKVEVVTGDFPGLQGYYFPHSRSKSGNICIRVSQNLATVVYDIKADYIRILEFAKGSKRVYDHIDAIIPNLYAALRSFSQNLPLPEKMSASLLLFRQRFGNAKTGQKKTDAKLTAILLAIATILGDITAETELRQRLQPLRPAVTSPQTSAFLSLLDALTGPKEAKSVKLNEGLKILDSISQKNSETLFLLRSEYSFHLALPCK